MIRELYTVKSFIVMGKSLDRCYNCDYCRADDDLTYKFTELPSSINPLFRRLPVAVNLFYGDPVLQWDHTIELLTRLEEDHHTGVVTIITKGKLPELPKVDLDLHIGISIGPDEVSRRNFEYNLEVASQSGYKYSIEYRPICKGINDSESLINYITSMAGRYNTCIAYSGLQLPPKGLSDRYVPYDGRKFSGQKYVSREVDSLIQQKSRENGITAFRKTSCLISYMHNFNRDYNSHYLKPIGVGCSECPMHDRCGSYKFNGSDIELPFEYQLTVRSGYTCSFVRNGLCKVPNPECLNMSGTFITPDLNEVTRGGARVIKWLTGCMVDGDIKLIETPYLSDIWRI